MSVTPSPKPYSAPSRQIWAWGVGALANHILICTYGQANNIFTIGFGIKASLVSLAMVLPRLIDGLTDPILGHLSDNTHTRWGRRKPFLVVGASIAAIALFALWWADRSWSNTAQLVYLFSFGTLFYCAWGLYSMSWNAIGYELTDDYHERSKVSAIGSLFLGIVLLGNSWTFWLTLRPIFVHGVGNTLRDFIDAGLDWERFTAVWRQAFYTVQGAPTNAINGIRWISGIVGIIALAATFFAVRYCKERFQNVPAAKHKVAIIPAIRATFKNAPFRSLVLIKACQTLGERAAAALLVPYIAIYYVCQGDQSLGTKITGIGATFGSIWIFAMIPMIKPVSKLIGKKGGLILGAGGGLFAALVIPFTYTPAHPYWMLLPTLVTITLLSISNTIVNAIMPDICDVDELETGQRREGLFTAVMGFVQKIEISLCILLVGYILDWVGFNGSLTTQPAEVLNRLYWLSVIPNIIFTSLCFILALRFPLTEAMMTEVRKQLDKRHQAAAAAATSSAASEPDGRPLSTA
jgi:GPH family glycoside/pentoside/hexuronide:cation symporter